MIPGNNLTAPYAIGGTANFTQDARYSIAIVRLGTIMNPPSLLRSHAVWQETVRI